MKDSTEWVLFVMTLIVALAFVVFLAMIMSACDDPKPKSEPKPKWSSQEVLKVNKDCSVWRITRDVPVMDEHDMVLICGGKTIERLILR